MIVRIATDFDVPAMTEILNEVIEIGGTTAYEVPISAEYFTPFLTSHDPKIIIHVVEEDQVMGFQWLKPDEEGLGNIATFAKPGHTKRGLGSALFQKTRTTAKAAGYDVIKAIIRGDNVGGLKFYAHLGFLDHAIDEGIPLNNGTPVDRIQKRISL